MSRLIIPPRENYPFQPNQINQSQRDYQIVENEINDIPQNKFNEIYKPLGVQNDQPYMAPPPIINNIQNPYNIQNEPNQNLLDYNELEDLSFQNRLKMQKCFSLNLFLFSLINILFSISYADFDRVKKKRKNIAKNFFIFYLIATALMLIVGIMMFVKTMKKKTTKNIFFFVSSLISAGTFVPVVVYCILYPEECMNLLMFVELILMISISIYNICKCE